jgi:hypothetical protein
LAKQHGANVLLGSATPSLESFYLANTGKYGYAELTERFGTGELPTLRFIDTRAVLKEDKTRISLTPLLIKKIKEVLSRKRQIILFQNRRGYSPYQICTVCGWIPRCEHCDVSLTYHKKNHQLRCHYCGTQYPPVPRCHSCGNPRFGQRSFGTERIEEQIREQFPGSRVARMDVDTVRGKEAHDKLIRQFEDGSIDILIGTQMVVKGLDFERVDLVGILDADGLLHFADFRANERAIGGRQDHRENDYKPRRNAPQRVTRFKFKHAVFEADVVFLLPLRHLHDDPGRIRIYTPIVPVDIRRRQRTRMYLHDRLLDDLAKWFGRLISAKAFLKRRQVPTVKGLSTLVWVVLGRAIFAFWRPVVRRFRRNRAWPPR